MSVEVLKHTKLLKWTRYASIAVISIVVVKLMYFSWINSKNYLVVRPSNVYGPGDNFDPDNAMVIPSLMYRILNNEDPLVVWGDGSAIRDFVYSKDVAIGLLKSAYYKFQVDFINDFISYHFIYTIF